MANGLLYSSDFQSLLRGPLVHMELEWSVCNRRLPAIAPARTHQQVPDHRSEHKPNIMATVLESLTILLVQQICFFFCKMVKLCGTIMLCLVDCHLDEGNVHLVGLSVDVLEFG